MKECANCKQKKTLTFFQKDRQQKNGFKPYCRDCSNARAKIYYERNRKDRLEKIALYNKTRPKERVNAYSFIYKAIKKGKLIKPSLCSFINKSDLKCQGSIEAHHPSGYGSKSRAIILWLCSTHHMKEHYQYV